jgi:hypothetical protein
MFNKSYVQIDHTHSLYQNSIIDSEKFSSHKKDVLSFISSFLNKKSKVVEIGCGKGNFFEMLLADGFANLVGFDAAYNGENVLINKRYICEKGKEFNAKLIVMRHTLEHIVIPVNFLGKLFRINGNKDASIVIEVPCMAWIVENCAWWDLSYEHCNYFSEKSFKKIFPNCLTKRVFNI